MRLACAKRTPNTFAGEPSVRKAVIGMRYNRFVGLSALLLLSIGACSSDNDPVSPPSRLVTEVLVSPNEVEQGDFANVFVKFIAATEDDVEVSFDHSRYVGYRVKSAAGVRMQKFPGETGGAPATVVVRQGFDVNVTIGVPTRRPLVGTAYDPPVTWLGGAENLPAGEYIIEAGFYGLEGRYRWGRTTFTVLDPVNTLQ